NHRDIQSLLRDQDFDIGTPERRRNRRVEKWLGETAVRKSEWLIRFLARAMSSLVARYYPNDCVRLRDRPKHQSSPGRALQIGFRFQDLRIFLNRLLKQGIQGQGVPRDGAGRR